MFQADSRRSYYRLTITATDPNTDIWLVDNLGHLVQKGTGMLDTSLLPGDYAVEFGLGTSMYPIHLENDTCVTQAALGAGPTCPRRIPQLLDNATE
jgi:hypothetical protein